MQPSQAAPKWHEHWFGGGGSGMSWGVVGFLASLVPWGIVLLLATDVVGLPCWGMATAALKCSWCVAATVAVLASTTGLLRRVAVGWAMAGLALGWCLASRSPCPNRR